MALFERQARVLKAAHNLLINKRRRQAIELAQPARDSVVALRDLKGSFRIAAGRGAAGARHAVDSS